MGSELVFKSFYSPISVCYIGESPPPLIHCNCGKSTSSNLWKSLQEFLSDKSSMLTVTPIYNRFKTCRYVLYLLEIYHYQGRNATAQGSPLRSRALKLKHSPDPYSSIRATTNQILKDMQRKISDTRASHTERKVWYILILQVLCICCTAINSITIYEEQLERQMAVTTAADSKQGFVWMMKSLGNYCNWNKEKWKVYRGNLL